MVSARGRRQQWGPRAEALPPQRGTYESKRDACDAPVLHRMHELAA